MKILFVTGALVGGGAEKVISNLANYFSNEQDVGIVQLVNSETYILDERIKLFKYEGKRTIFSPFKKKSFIKKCAKQFKADIVISFMTNINILSILALKGTKIKCICSERNDPNFVPNSKLIKFLRRIVYRFGDFFVFQTNDAKKYFSKKIQNKSIVIKNPLNPLFIKYKSRLSDDVIVMSGRLEKVKNYEMALSAFSHLSNHYKTLKLVIYGVGSEYSHLIDYAKKLNINSSVTFAGFSENWHQTVKDAKVYWLTSDHEGMSNSLIEAMALGIVCVSTDHPIGGAREVIKDNETGFLIPINDSALLAEKTLNLLSNNTLLTKLSTNGFNYAREEFDCAKICKEWLKVCNTVVNK